MIYHLMIQDKFIDSYIEDIYSINEEANNIFWIRGSKNDSDYIKTTRAVEYVGNDFNGIKSKLKNLSPSDKIFVHWYDVFAAKLVEGLPNTLLVFFWGGEFYEHPFWHHAKWIYDSKTFKIVKKKTYPKISFSTNYKIFKKSIKKILLLKIETKKLYDERLEQAKRIDFIICSKLNTFEIEILRDLYPSLKAKHLFGSYDINFDLAKNIEVSLNSSKKIKILVGNSAAPANNHFDAFLKLKNLKNVEIYCSLSYGADWYKELVIKEGRKIFGNNFFPISEFMTRDKYVQFLSEMDIVYMFHNRSQAWGNIAIGLSLGKPVFIKLHNPLNQYIHKIGINTYDVNQISEKIIKDSIAIEHKLKEENILKLNNSISNAIRLKELKELMEYIENYNIN